MARVCRIGVAQNAGGHLVRHRRQQLVARRRMELAGSARGAKRDLDVDLGVGGIRARGIIDRVGVDPASSKREFDAPALGHAEIGALADHLHPHVLRRRPDRVVRLVVHLRASVSPLART